MKKQIASFSVHQTAKVFALLSFLMGLVGVIISLISGALSKNHGTVAIHDSSNLSIDKFSPDSFTLDSLGIYVLLLPFVYLIFGYLAWLLIGFIYNIIAKQFGGIEFDLTDIE